VGNELLQDKPRIAACSPPGTGDARLHKERLEVGTMKSISDRVIALVSLFAEE
jgi:hypothetical protein